MTSYRERLRAPLSWWVAVAAFAVTCGWIVLLASSTVPAVIAGLAGLAVAGGVVGRYGATTITVDADAVRVGRASLPRAHVGGAEALPRTAYREVLGTGADARAYLVTRPYLDRGVRVVVDDPADTTPYWVVSSRRPDELASAIGPVQGPVPPTAQETSRAQEA